MEQAKSCIGITYFGPPDSKPLAVVEYFIYDL